MPLSVGGVLHVLLQRLGPLEDVSPTKEEERFGAQLVSLITDSVIGSFEFSETEEIEMDESFEGDPDWIPDDDSSDSSFLEADKSGGSFIRFSTVLVSVARVDEALCHYRSSETGSRSLSSMASQFRFISTPSHLAKLRDYEKRGKLLEDRRRKLLLLSEEMVNEICQKMDLGISLHDADLQIMALRINRDKKYLDDFKASHSWIQRFKKAHRLCSRKITKFVTKKSLQNQDEVADQAKKVVDSVRKIILDGHPLTAIVNADQSGIQKELHFGRSLAPVGVKKVERLVQSTSSLTHSYTVMPLLYADGHLDEKLFVVLPEPTGKFPASGIFNAANLVVRCHTSHIMTKSLMCDWLNECVLTPAMPNKLVLLLDSWSGFRDKNLIQSLVPISKEVEIVTIPPGATGLAQPLDLYFFGFFKRFIRRISSFVLSNNIDFQLSKRDNILKLLSVVFHQFRAPRFQPFLLYSWHAGKYFDLHPGFFSTPLQFCFTNDAIGPCSEQSCPEIAFVKCAHCLNNLCFHHFITVNENAVVKIYRKVAAVGTKEITNLLWSYAKNAKFISVTLKTTARAISRPSASSTRNEHTSAWNAKRYWVEIDGSFKIVYGEYDEVKTLLKDN